MKSLPKQLEDYKGKVIWITSYPKSGNTWFRCFLSALFTGKVDINKLETDGIFSNRQVFDKIHDVDGRLFSEDEVKLRMNQIYEFHAKYASQLKFIKVHDAYSKDIKNKPLFSKKITQKVIYLARNPLDVVGSFANHNNISIERTIKLMNFDKGYLAPQTNGMNINNQFPQLLMSWGGHVTSWVKQKHLDVHVMKYEDMKKNPNKVFYDAVKSMGFKATKKQVTAALDLAKFERLQQKEQEGGFKEKNAASPTFFRKGISGGWKNELTVNQAKEIIDKNKSAMNLLGYEIPNL